MRVLNQSPNKKNSSSFCGKVSSLFVSCREACFFGLWVVVGFLGCFVFVFLFPKNFYFSSENKSFGVCTRTFFFASFENILPVRFVREEEKRDGK